MSEATVPRQHSQWADGVAFELGLVTGWENVVPATAADFAAATGQSLDQARHVLNRAADYGYVVKHQRSGRGPRFVYEPVLRACRVCGCTSAAACEGGCWWAEYDLCTSCVPAPPRG